MTASPRIESVRIRGFGSLADVELLDLRNVNVLIGAQRLRRIQLLPLVGDAELDAAVSPAAEAPSDAGRCGRYSER